MEESPQTPDSPQTNPPKINPWMISTLILAGIVVGFGVSQIPAFEGGTQQAAVVKPTPPPQAAAQKEEPENKALTAEQIAKLPDDDTVIGDPNAPITLVEFSDFQCPYCARFFKTTLPLIEENYIKTGKVKWIYRDFPIGKHAQAELTAQTAECADEQGEFKQMHDLLFSEQETWAGNEDAPKLMKEYAKKLGLDAKKFNECLDSKKYALEVRKDLVDGATSGISGTPGFFVNGKIISGAMPYEEVFKPIFDAELAGKKWELQFDALGNPSVKIL
jgi:protein-disulfide isomerase